ncbi:ribonuclease H-like domain-containing protein [Tanacetum coccineum]
MWLFRHKYLADGMLSRNKARLVANDSTQLEGVDVDETFSPVVKPDTIRTVLSLAASRHWSIHQLDVKNAFLHGDLSETETDIAYLLLYVDDIVLTAFFTAGLFSSQNKYAIEILDRAHVDNCNPSRTAIDTESKLGADGDSVFDPILYRSLAGSLRILRYVQGTMDYGLQLFSSSTTDLVAYSDADWAGCPTKRRSTSGYCIFLGNNLLSWSSKHQPTLSRSSAKAEYRGVANVVAETCWLRNLLGELHTPLSSATLILYRVDGDDFYENCDELWFTVINNPFLKSIFSSCYLFRNPFSSTTMGDENHIRTLGDYSKPSHEGYRKTIELPAGNNVCEIDCAADDKLCNKNTDESWEIIENLALYGHEGWDETKEFVKLVKAISIPQGIPKTPDWRLLELEDQINFLQKGSRPTPTLSSTHTPHAYINAVHPDARPQNQKELPKLNTFAFREPHTERMERFENTIFKQREKINGRMTEMFGLLKELTTSRTLEKVLIKEEATFPITKNVNFISLAINEEEENNKTDETPDNTKMPTEMKMPVRKAEHKINEKLIKGLVNNSIFNNSRSGTRVGKKKGKEYKILPGGPAYDAILKKMITRKGDIEGNFKIPCSIGNLKHVNALIDQGSDVNVMPYSTYIKLTNSLASHSNIYPLGIVEDVLVEVAEHASIKFDTGTITLRSGKSKVSFGIGGNDKATLRKRNAVQPMEEQEIQK